MEKPVFIIDTNVISQAIRHIDYDAFIDFYENWSKGILNGNIIPIKLVHKELKKYFETDEFKNNRVYKWLQDNQGIFKETTSDDSEIVTQIVQLPKFKNRYSEKNYYAKNISFDTDLFLVAKATNTQNLLEKGIIVTNESRKKPNCNKIPNLCVEMEVPFLSGNEFFYAVNQNIRYNKDPLDKIELKLKLDL